MMLCHHKASVSKIMTGHFARTISHFRLVTELSFTENNINDKLRCNDFVEHGRIIVYSVEA